MTTWVEPEWHGRSSARLPGRWFVSAVRFDRCVGIAPALPAPARAAAATRLARCGPASRAVAHGRRCFLRSCQRPSCRPLYRRSCRRRFLELTPWRFPPTTQPCLVTVSASSEGSSWFFVAVSRPAPSPDKGNEQRPRSVPSHSLIFDAAHSGGTARCLNATNRCYQRGLRMLLASLA